MKLIKYYIYRFWWHLAYFLPYGKLIHLDIEINNNCNQKCIFCWHSNNKLNFDIKEMLAKDVYTYLEQGFEVGAKSVKFNLRGEPLLNKNLKKYIKYAKKLGYIDIMINTNGILLTPIQAIAFDEVGLTKCIVSLDSLQPLNYTKLHGCSVNQFKNLIKNILFLKKLSLTGKLNLKIIFNFHKNEINKNEPFRNYKTFLHPFKINMKKTMNREGIKLSFFKKTKRKRMCPHLKRRLTITANKKIYPCCVCYNEPTDIRLYEKNIFDAFYGAKRKQMIRDYKKKNFFKTCLECTSGDIYV